MPVYPALANALVAPLSLLPFWAAGVLFSVATVAAMIAGMWLLGVTDRRCLLLTLVSWPFMFGFFLGAVGPFLVLGAGVAWRWRERLWAPALAIATLVAVKVFPWTLGVWLLITRRYRAAAVAAVFGVVLTLAAWALIGFQDLAQYPRMLSEVSSLQENRAVSVAGVLVLAGVGSGAANVVVIAAGLAILALARRLASGPDGDRRAFGLAVLAALTATPIVWQHYMVLLFVPIALMSPRLSRIWLIPILPGILTAVSYVVFPAAVNTGSLLGRHPADHAALAGRRARRRRRAVHDGAAAPRVDGAALTGPVAAALTPLTWPDGKPAQRAHHPEGHASRHPPTIQRSRSRPVRA